MIRSVVLFAFAFCLLLGSARALRNTGEERAPLGNSVVPSLEAFPFIVPDKNVLHFPGSQENWKSLFNRMEHLTFEGEGKISMMHIGGSHVQGGWLTDKLRYHFNRLNYGVEGERGFVFPYKMAGTNNPRTIEFSWTGAWTGCRSSVSSHQCDWGVSGISATTYDTTATVSVASHSFDSTYYQFNRVIVYHQGSAGYCVIPDERVTVHRINENMADGYTEFYFTPAVDHFTFRLEAEQKGGYFSLQGVFLGNDNPGVTYHAIGVNGAGTYSYLKCAQFEGQLATLRPDMVVFGIGVNDANVPEGDFSREEYEARYDSLIRMFRRVNPDVCFLFVTNNDTYFNKKRPNRNALKVQQAMYNLAARHNGAVYDLFEVMGGLGSIDKWVASGLASKDRIHFTRKGYELQADLMFDAFRKSFGDYLAEAAN
jgi:lysophospholipase L1-like esterase